MLLKAMLYITEFQELDGEDCIKFDNKYSKYVIIIVINETFYNRRIEKIFKIFIANKFYFVKKLFNLKVILQMIFSNVNYFWLNSLFGKIVRFFAVIFDI